MTLFWILVAVVVIGLIIYYLTTGKKKGPVSPKESEEPEEPFIPPTSPTPPETPPFQPPSETPEM